MKSPALVGVGVLIGIAAGAMLGLRLRGPASEPAPPPTWREMAEASTMAGRRVYTLPLNNPDMVPAEKAGYMKDDDQVLGVYLGGKARAYPWWLVSNYHVVNDTVGDEPLLLTLCEVCGGTAAFRPQLPDLPEIALSFQICGVDRGTIEIMDYQTHSRWRPFLGLAFDGPLTGKTLQNVPLQVMTWKEWRQRYPSSLVANGSADLRLRPHGAAACGRIGDSDLPALFAAHANLTDSRLKRNELVLGVFYAQSHEAFAVPLSRLTPYPNVFQVQLGPKQVLVVRDGEFALTTFQLDPAQASHRFSLVSTSPIVFRGPDGRTWNAFGVRTNGGSGVEALPAARSYMTEWYEWVSHSPQSEISTSVAVVYGPSK